ncbi:MAG: YsnF/AvaK domain-containing protein [Brachybacterium sp.]
MTDGGGVTLHEEQAHVGTEKVQTGRVRLRKHVVTDTEQVEVPVQREELVLEREPADGRAGGTLSEEEVDVTLTEERPVVEKETVVLADHAPAAGPRTFPWEREGHSVEGPERTADTTDRRT